MRVGRWWGIGVCVGEAKTVYIAAERQRVRAQRRTGHTRHGGRAQCGSGHVPGVCRPFAHRPPPPMMKGLKNSIVSLEHKLLSLRLILCSSRERAPVIQASRRARPPRQRPHPPRPLRRRARPRPRRPIRASLHLHCRLMRLRLPCLRSTRLPRPARATATVQHRDTLKSAQAPPRPSWLSAQRPAT